MSVSSSSWGLGRAAVCDCGTLTFFPISLVRFSENSPSSLTLPSMQSLSCSTSAMEFDGQPNFAMIFKRLSRLNCVECFCEVKKSVTFLGKALLALFAVFSLFFFFFLVLVFGCVFLFFPFHLFAF